MTAFLILLLQLLFPPGPAPSDCRALLLRAYKSMSPAGGGTEETKVLHVQMLTQAFYIPPGQKKERQSSSTIELYSQGKRLAYLTPLVSTWQDENYSATVIKPRKTVIISRSQQVSANAQMGAIATLRDSLLREGTIAQCSSAQADGRETYLELKLAIKTAKKTHVQSMDFWLDNQHAIIKKMRINYMPGSLQTHTVITFNKQELLTSTNALPENVRRQVITADGRLQPIYAGYRLLDQSTLPPK